LAGVNCRDLSTLQIVPQRLDELAQLLPTSVPRVAESGVATAEDAGRLAAAGYELALVGSALMQGADPRALAAAMLDAGRGARAALRGAQADATAHDHATAERPVAQGHAAAQSPTRERDGKAGT
jgi:thiazole synthase ThiGH ThiG subunit